MQDSRTFKGFHAIALAASLMLAAGAAAADVDPQAGGTGVAPAAQGSAVQSDRDRISYAVGMQTGRALRTADGAEVDIDALVQGLKDGLAGARSQVPERQMQELLGKFQQALRQKMAASHGRAVAENRVKAQKFLDENGRKPETVTLSSGVQYHILKPGNGRKPTEADVVTVNYRGTLLNGSEFDASDPGRPAKLNVGGLIGGWREALKVMPVGSHWEIYIPPELAYGERGVGSEIGPNELLVFDVELLDAQHPEREN